MYKLFTIASALVGSALALTSPPSGALTVGSSGKYSTIQEAVDALDTSSSSDQTIFIYSGDYKEQVIVPELSGSLTVYGYSDSETDYSSNAVTITAAKSQDDGLDNDGTATLAVHTGNFFMYNVNVANTHGEGSQAVALSAYAEGNMGFYACQFTGYQDTLLAQEGNQIYAKSYIEGATDFIFGQLATAWFEDCTIGVLAASKGYVTANGAKSSGASYYVINKSKVQAASGQSVSSGAYYLGRPWGEYAQVVFQNSELSDVINAAGWSVWNTDEPRTSGVSFGEYGNTGDGASTSSRASFSKQLSAAVSISDVISDYSSWADKTFIS
ncbi:pectinesterase-like protein [Phyllosticta citribraziliensis]|uniref:Pectinesterase n=1 Tax=Phyllosticta citribraziliensis TaxID=989973 RepID=A0ABR1LL76_9PEZI